MPSRLFACLLVLAIGCAKTPSASSSEADAGTSPELDGGNGDGNCQPSDSQLPLAAALFWAPYQDAIVPTMAELTAQAKVTRADVVILMDATESMDPVIESLLPALEQTITELSTEVDDLAFGLAGYGDIPSPSSSVTTSDIPYFPVHRVMTARTEAGLDSLLDTIVVRDIRVEGVGPWFSMMHGGDEPEHGWEALRQLATGVGLRFRLPWADSATATIPAFDPQSVFPQAIPEGEEVGVGGGLGFRSNSLPIVLLVSDSSQHSYSYMDTTPTEPSSDEAVEAMNSMGAKVVGLLLDTWPTGWGHRDMTIITEGTGAIVSPEVWGPAGTRPGNCPVGYCCLLDPNDTGSATNYPAEDEQCPLVFRTKRANVDLTSNMIDAVRFLTRDGRFDISATVVDDPGDAVDVLEHFVDRVEAVDCGDATASDTDGDGRSDTFVQAQPGTDLCFQVFAKNNETLPPSEEAQVYHATLRLLGDGIPYLNHLELAFVVPAQGCEPVPEPECQVGDCPTGEFCENGICREKIQ